MNMIIRLFGTVVGTGIVVLSTYWGFNDNRLLSQANAELTQSARQLSQREFEYLLSREQAHRLNVGFEGTWIVMGIMVIILSNQSK